MKVYEPFEFRCPHCGAKLKPDGSLGLFFCPECRKIYDAGENRHLAKESRFYRNTLRKSAPDVFTVAVFSYYESVTNTDERAEAEKLFNGGGFICNGALTKTFDICKPAGVLNELLRCGREEEMRRERALSLISAMPVELKRGGSPLAKAYEDYTADFAAPCDLREAVEMSEELYCRGSSYYSERRYTEAVKNLTSSANMGHTKACYLLAMCYVKGQGVDKDVSAAIDFMRRAADGGDQDAQFELGMIYGNARLGVKDTRESAKWLRRAADQGDRRAQGILGVYYLNGIGVPQSDSNAVLWVRKAAAQGFAEAQCMLGAVYADGRGVNKNIPEARIWYKKAIAQGNRLAEEQLGGLERELAEQRRRREQAEQRRMREQLERRVAAQRSASSSGGGRSGSSYSPQRSGGSSSKTGGKFNWVIFIVLLFFGGGIGAWIYLIAAGGKTAKVVGGIFLAFYVILLFVAIGGSCNTAVYAAQAVKNVRIL